MNQLQQNYLTAKALHATWDNALKELEKKYIINNKLDVTFIYEIEDDELFHTHNIAFSESCKQVTHELNESRTLLHQAEEQLIDWSLKFIPEEHKEMISTNRKNYIHRQRILELITRLEVA